MTVQTAAAPTVAVPRQAGPADPPLSPVAEAPAAPAAPLLGRDRPLTPEERQFAVGLVVMAIALTAIIVTGPVMAQHVWS